MNCTVVYGLNANIKHEEEKPVADAFRFVTERTGGWAFYNVYFGDELVYTTQGCAGYRYKCENCPYPETIIPRSKLKFVYG